MVDRQTPTVEADAETERDAEAVRDGDAATARPAEADREVAPERMASATRAAEPAGATESSDPATTATSSASVASSGSAASSTTGAATESPSSDSNTALFDRDSAQGFQERWINIQTEFVDSPRQAVEKAEQLVGEVMDQLTETFSRERRDLESRWSGGDREVSTEDLRQAIRRYRSFFNRLLAL